MNWQIQEAKQRFSELVRRATTEGPQVVTRHGEEVVAVIAMKEYRRLHPGGQDFKSFLMHGPDFEPLQLQRDDSLSREVDLV